MNRNRIVYLEFIRIVAIISVLFNHTNGYGFYLFSNSSNVIEYSLSMFLSIVCKTAVPLFFMVSGAVLMEKEENIFYVLRRRVMKYGIIICVSTAFVYMMTQISQAMYSFSIREVVKMIYRGSDIASYWFLYAYMGLLLMLPFIRDMKKALNIENVYYLFFLRILLGGVVPIVIFVFLGYSMGTLLNVFLIEDPIFYFLLGYYFSKQRDYWLKRKYRVVSAIMAIISIAIMGFMIYYEYEKVGVYSENYINTLLPFVVVYLFTGIRHVIENRTISEKTKRIFTFLGDKTLGIYLLEPVLRLFIKEYYWNVLATNIPRLVASIIWCIMIATIGCILTSIIKLGGFTMKKKIGKWITLAALTLALSLGFTKEAKAAEATFAINGYINEFKTLDVGAEIVGVQGYSGMSYNGTVLTVQIPSGYKDTKTLPAYFYYKDPATGATLRATIYITPLYKEDADELHQENYHTQALEDSHKRYVEYLTKLYPAGYNFIRQASGEEASILMDDDHLTARVCHMGNTIARIQVIGVDGSFRKIYVLDSKYVNGDAYIGLYTNHDDGLPQTYVISDADKATLLERGIKGVWLNAQYMPFE